MKLWIARDFDGKLALQTREPHCPFYTWYSGDEVALNEDLFPEITFENSPQHVEIKFINGYTCFSDSTLKIVFNSSVVEEKIDTNPINNNVISNTLNNDSISNTINENTSVQNYLNNVNFNRVMP